MSDRDGGTRKPIRDASTVIVLRHAEHGLETFMLCRHGQSGFMGGAHVFPGGKVDAADGDAAWLSRFDQEPPAMAALLGEPEVDNALGLWVGAIRETFEEAGLLLSPSVQATGAADLAAARQRLEDGLAFLALADELDLKFETATLTPYARWVTPKMESKRYDTRFFIAMVPEGQVASHDGTETTSAVWLAPSAVLDGMRGGRIKLAPPTVRTLEWLSGFDDPSEVLGAAAARVPPLVRPEIVSGERGWFLALPGDPAHPEDDQVLPGSTRMVMEGGAWVDAPMPVS
ncbi:MAG: NUDIX hydrolase [Myxococcota bacterium]